MSEWPFPLRRWYYVKWSLFSGYIIQWSKKKKNKKQKTHMVYCVIKRKSPKNTYTSDELWVQAYWKVVKTLDWIWGLPKMVWIIYVPFCVWHPEAGLWPSEGSEKLLTSYTVLSGRCLLCVHLCWNFPCRTLSVLYLKCNSKVLNTWTDQWGREKLIRSPDLYSSVDSQCSPSLLFSCL